ncbi:glycosyltransferase family 4 protein [Moheibacter sediminis]|uniref:Glycosyltransferase involved in cell wall bisynthesis n=1 Tax=Moheibacter sediminis TaxID=1434700 RepID=A0A1W1ZBV7_9FLAO|nr:glycosyltransferase family 4 protein [Moheibacter sediminis]SMC45701.1 Glycosyltransferase involved in cell wall bisynthesis [Moheibacter sediminis]
MKKKVLIITYYWPPAGGPGVQRWLKFAKYLPEFGIEPIIYTPENPSYPIIDESLLNEVSPDLKILKTKIWEPYQIAEKLNSKSKQYKAGQFEKAEKQSFLTRLAVFVRGNFFIPDARQYWVEPSVRFLRKYLKENQIETIITTGPPHSLHLIGYKLKEFYPELKWLADFRDPWTQISYHSELKLTSFAQKSHEILERKVLKNADAVIATSFTDAENYKNLGAGRVEVITNGFEEPDFNNSFKIQNSKFKISYSGGLEFARNPLVVWQALDELIQENSEFSTDFELEFIGNLSQEVENSIINNNLSDYLIKKGYVSHKESIELIKNSTLLLLTNFPDEKSKGIIPGKIFEYMATGNPILAIGPGGADVEKILTKTESGSYFTHQQNSEVKSFISEEYKKWKTNFFKNPSSKIHQYSRKSLTERLSQLISSL